MLGLFFIGLGIAGGIGYAIKSSYDANLAKELGLTYFDGNQSIDPRTGECANVTTADKLYNPNYSKRCHYSEEDFIRMGSIEDSEHHWFHDIRDGDRVIDGTSGILKNYNAEARCEARKVFKPIEEELLKNAKEKAIAQGENLYLKQIDAEMYYDVEFNCDSSYRGNLYWDMKTGRFVVKRIYQERKKTEEYHVTLPSIFNSSGEEIVNKLILNREMGTKSYILLLDPFEREIVRIADETLESITDFEKQCLEDFMWNHSKNKKDFPLVGNYSLQHNAVYEPIIKDEKGCYSLNPTLDLYNIDFSNNVVVDLSNERYDKEQYDRYNLSDKGIKELSDLVSNSYEFRWGGSAVMLNETVNQIRKMNRFLCQELGVEVRIT